MILFASDLDNTLIYTRKKIQDPVVCIEKLEGKEHSFMTEDSHNRLQNIITEVCFVPITTRSRAQYARIKLLNQGVPTYSLTSNGGILLYNHEIDRKWYEDSLKLIEDSMDELNKAKQLLEHDLNVQIEVRLVDGLFVFTKSEDADETIKQLEKQLDLNHVTIERYRAKVYVLPKLLTKGIALNRLKEKLNAKLVIAAGDSEFDLPMLRESDWSVIPNEAKLIESLDGKQNLVVCEQERYLFGEKVLDVVVEVQKRGR